MSRRSRKKARRPKALARWRRLVREAQSNATPARPSAGIDLGLPALLTKNESQAGGSK